MSKLSLVFHSEDKEHRQVNFKDTSKGVTKYFGFFERVINGKITVLFGKCDKFFNPVCLADAMNIGSIAAPKEISVCKNFFK